MHVALARARFATWAPTHVSETDSLVLEANAKAWVLSDNLIPAVRVTLLPVCELRTPPALVTSFHGRTVEHAVNFVESFPCPTLVTRPPFSGFVSVLAKHAWFSW